MENRVQIFNTLTKKVETIVPYVDGKIGMYTCGPTVYHYAHIGNLRSYIMEDVLEKTLRFVGYDVKRVMNITDVGHLTSDSDTGDDKMVKEAEKEHKTVMEIAAFYTDAFFKDCARLNIKTPDVVQPATGCIPEFIHMIEVLLEKGYAYKAGDNIYFDTSKLENYYVLSPQAENELLVGVRDDVTEDTNKRNKADFVLWFTKSKFGNQDLKWESPWGLGYPGWHIECSCISMKYLGENLDIHCGGIDNIFPHHTNEIAQTESYTGHSWCKYWFHVHHLTEKGGSKISKSKGTFLNVDYLIEQKQNPIVYRMFCLQSHYRKPLEFSFDTMGNVAVAYDKLKKKIAGLKKDCGLTEKEISVLSDVLENARKNAAVSSSDAKAAIKEAVLKTGKDIDYAKYYEYVERFTKEVCNDLNTSMGITLVYDVLRDSMNSITKLMLISAFDYILSLDLMKDDESAAPAADSELETFVLAKIEERKEAKKNKDFARADAIRDELLAKGVAIKDTREGTVWEIVG